MGNDKDGASFHQFIHAPLHDGLGAGVDGRGRLIQNHDRGICHSRAGDGQQLPLSLGEVAAVVAQRGIVALRQTGNEIVCAGQFGGLAAFFVGGIQPSVANVVHHGTGEEVGFL